MAMNPSVRVDLVQVDGLREAELEEAGAIVRLAFGTFLGMPNPMEFMGDRDFVGPRWRSRNTRVLAAREGGKLIGLNVLTRWGSFAFFGPLTVLPEYWERGVAQALLRETAKALEEWQVQHSGLFTFAHSPKHVGLYQKFGYWPSALTALMKRTPAAPEWKEPKGAKMPVLLSALAGSDRQEAMEACAKLTDGLETGLDLSEEMRAVLAQHTGEVVLTQGRRGLEGFAICMHGAGSEGGQKLCYVKFAVASSGERFERLLDAIDALAVACHSDVEAGVSLACEDAYLRMLAHGYRAMTLGVAMHRPHGDGFNGPQAYLMGDWR
jgi:GNAT superfamily N-acetyltransferase